MSFWFYLIMLNEQSSESCSTCSGSADGSCYDSEESGLHESDLEWMQESKDHNGNLFYLKVLNKIQEQNETKLDSSLPSKLATTDQRWKSFF